MGNGLVLLRTTDKAEWLRLLRRTAAYDVYHGPCYHRNAELNGEGIAYLLHYRDGPYSILLPLLLRSLDGIDGAQDVAAGWYDATSVYGYAGPVASHHSVPSSVRSAFQQALRGALSDLRVVSLFARFHPLLNQEELVTGLGECRHLGETVSIELRESDATHCARYRRNHKRDIVNLVNRGATVIRDTQLSYLDDFVRLYHETMRRAGASPYYFLAKAYFARLLTAPELNAFLFVCLHERRPCCCALFTECNGIVQYHYSGTAAECVRLSPLKLLLHDVQRWSAQQRFRVLHLGGGRGGQRDSLFYFKAGFSPTRHRFAVWRWITEPDMYDKLVEVKRGCRPRISEAQRQNDCFPAYRDFVRPTASAQCETASEATARE